MAIKLNRYELGLDGDGCNEWQLRTTEATPDYSRCAVILCDVWDLHWNTGAVKRLARLLPAIERLTCALRDAGALIIHAPSECMDFYAGTKARQRAIECPRMEPVVVRDVPETPYPLDASDGGNDANEPKERVNRRVWSRQHEAITIDDERDVISYDGDEIYSCLKARGIERVFIMGVHTNMCILGRPFGIKNMVRWGFDVALVRDLTDPMYNPALPPYVSRADALKLIVDYIERFWCPGVDSDDILADIAAR